MLILAGEANFILPFVLPRVFRPTVLEAYSLSNVELGACFSVYGIVAFFSYALGGGIADRFPPRKLMGVSLLLTALGGILLAQYPSFSLLVILYGYWGFTTIFLFWAAMIKATRVWGGKKTQGLAFGLLDGGRGLVSYLFGLLGVVVFGYFLGSGLENIPLLDLQSAYSQVVYSCTIVIAITAFLTYFFISDPAEDEQDHKRLPWQTVLKNYRQVLKLRSVWLLMIIVLCAYTGYKITDVYSLYAYEIMDYDQLATADIGKDLLGVRIVVGVIVGLIADRSRSSLVMCITFLIAGIGAAFFATGWIDAGSLALFWTAITFTAIGVYSLRALYFAAVQESGIPLAVTGTAVGLISLIGYTPDIFMGPIIGYFLDGYPGMVGFQWVFGLLVFFSATGFICSLLLDRSQGKVSQDV